MSRITLHNPGATHDFCIGDILSTIAPGDRMVIGIDHDRGEIITVRATWWRRAWYSGRRKVNHAWWWVRCTWADLRAREEEP